MKLWHFKSQWAEVKHGKHNQASHGRKGRAGKAGDTAYKQARAGGASLAEARAAGKAATAEERTREKTEAAEKRRAGLVSRAEKARELAGSDRVTEAQRKRYTAQAERLEARARGERVGAARKPTTTESVIIPATRTPPLPELDGTYKQVSYADSIRGQYLGNAATARERMLRHPDLTNAQRERLASSYDLAIGKQIVTRTSAKEWVEQRDSLLPKPQRYADIALEKIANITPPKTKPILTGSEKQVTWANSLRDRFEADAVTMRDRVAKEKPSLIPSLDRYIQANMQQKDASWWISRRPNQASMEDMLISWGLYSD
jgi:hypothetical protein